MTKTPEQSALIKMDHVADFRDRPTGAHRFWSGLDTTSPGRRGTASLHTLNHDKSASRHRVAAGMKLLPWW